MATASLRPLLNDYPTTDGKPMAETPIHMLVMWTTIQTLIDWYTDDPNVYVWGNMLLYYVKGDIKKNVSPDVFVVRGVGMRRRGALVRQIERPHRFGCDFRFLICGRAADAPRRGD